MEWCPEEDWPTLKIVINEINDLQAATECVCSELLYRRQRIEIGMGTRVGVGSPVGSRERRLDRKAVPSNDEVFNIREPLVEQGALCSDAI
jgi:hypothetical protein